MNDPSTELLLAILSDSVDGFRTARNDHRESSLDGVPLLHVAISSRATAIAGALIESGECHELDAEGSNAAIPAAQQGSVGLLEALAGAGVDVHASNSFAQTPLMIAAKFGMADACKWLISAGADVNARDVAGIVPLHYALQLDDNDEVVAVLLASGADAALRSHAGDSPLEYARALGRGSSQRLLLGRH